MAIKPILFNTDMVRAILDGRKTQTLRIVKGLDGLNVYRSEPSEDSYESLSEWDFFYGGCLPDGGLYDATKPVKAPCGIGDILWVKETFCALPVTPGGHLRGHDVYYYRAGEDLRPDGWRGNWKAARFMPKKAARIFLRVKYVRAERLQKITNIGAQAEGFVGVPCDHQNMGYYGCTDCMDSGWLEPPTIEFAELWDSTVKKSDLPLYGWNANPWVWAIEFERCEKPEGWCNE